MSSIIKHGVLLSAVSSKARKVKGWTTLVLSILPSPSVKQSRLSEGTT